jgi:hypothetical protein
MKSPYSITRAACVTRVGLLTFAIERLDRRSTQIADGRLSIGDAHPPHQFRCRNELAKTLERD